MATLDAKPRRRATPVPIPTAKVPSKRRTPRSTRTAIAENLQSVHSAVVRDVQASLTASAQVVDPNGSMQAGDLPGPNAVTRTWQQAVLGYCADPETEVLSRRGWLHYDELTTDDFILTLDHETGVSEWQQPSAVNVFDGEWDMVRFRSISHSSLTTMNHRWPVIETRAAWTSEDADLRRDRRHAIRDGDPRPGPHGAERPAPTKHRVWRQSSDLKARHAVLTGAPCSDLPTEPKWSDAFVELVAWFWTEGWIDNGGAIRISQSQTVNSGNVARIRAAIVTLFGSLSERLRPVSAKAAWNAHRAAGGTTTRRDWYKMWNREHPRTPRWSERLQPSGMVAFALNPEAAESLLEVAPNKEVSFEFILSLTRSQLELFLQTSLDADGHDRTLYQHSTRRLEPFALAVTLTGRTPHLKEHRDRPGAWSCYVSNGQRALPRARESMATTERHVGVVWCPTTPNASWFARRDRTVYFTGNSRSVPELNAAKMYVGNCLARCSLAVGKRSPDGSVEQGFDGDEPADGLDGEVAQEAADLISNLRLAVGGQSELLRSYGEKMFLAGELWLVPEDTPAGLVFEVLSTQELLKEGGGFTRFYGPGFEPAPLPPGTKPIRVWRSDTQYSKLADSSVRSCLEILEELVVGTRLVRSSWISRIALAGILAIADEFDSPDDEAAADGQTAEAMNPLAVDIINTGSKAIDDPASAAAWMPYILQGNVDLIDRGLKHISFNADAAIDIVKRQEAVDRLARGLDIPYEVVVGYTETKFANAVQINIDKFKLHIEPSLQLLCDALTIAYLWPAMAKARGIDAEHLKDAPYPDDILSVAVTYDASLLISRPDQTKDIVEAYKNDISQTAIRNSELREAVGLDPDTPPDEEETARRIDAIRLTKIREVIAAPPGDAAVPIEQAAEAVVPGESAGSTLIGEQAKTAKEEAVQQATVTAAGALSHRIVAAVELTAERACEKVGAKLRDKVRRLPSGDTTRMAVEGIGNEGVARILGADAARRLLGKDDPIAVELSALERSVARWAEEAALPFPSHIAKGAVKLCAAETRLRLFGEARPVPVEDCAALVHSP